MNTDEKDKTRLNAISERIIGAAFTVSNTFGVGFLEKNYENALTHEMRKNGLSVAQQHRMSVVYDNVVVGEYTADLLVESQILVELKAVNALDSAHTAQCLNYMKATGIPLCLLLNFGRARLEIKRLVWG